MKKGLLVIFLIICSCATAQIQSNNLNLKLFSVHNDSIQIDSVSINPSLFKVFSLANTEIDPEYYTIDFSKALLIFNSSNETKFDQVTIQYLSYPSFLTKTYTALDDRLILPNSQSTGQLYSLTTNSQKKPFNPFEGLNSTGHITRGITIGNNQNAVLNSMLDLQLAGKLSNKVTLKASIVDTNMPIQESGNTYELNEFDRIYIELFSDTWSINAGDIYLNNAETSFLNFNKKVSGINLKTNFKKKNNSINLETSGAIVRGKYHKISIAGIEGNQGPYQLSSFKNKYVLILAGTEKVYVDGLLLKRGDTNDYQIDYNTGELIFSTTFPITADSRITVEYQYNDREYSRFITYNKAAFASDKLSVNGYFYNEIDLKNQPLNQSLSSDQQQILADAGNELSSMVSPSAYIDSFSESKILYTKSLIGNTAIYEHSTNESEELYQVSFTYIGENLGDYRLKDVIASGKIYEYVGSKLGSYNPVIQLTAPTKLQLVVVKASYHPSEKTSINTETAISNNDANLFSSIDDADNNGLATKINWKQVISDKNWKLESDLNLDYIQNKFKSIERIQEIEFNRDWNLDQIIGTQRLFQSQLKYSKDSKKFLNYTFENLAFGDFYKGSRHQLNGVLNTKKLHIVMNGSALSNKDEHTHGNFLRYRINANYQFSKSWIGLKTNSAQNERYLKSTSNYLGRSFNFHEYETYAGLGDSSSINLQIGLKVRITDSIRNNSLVRVNNAKTYYLKSTLINTKNTSLNAYINYRSVENEFRKDKNSLNSQVNFKKQLFNQFINLNTSYQSLAGNLPQQDYQYLKTEPGQGYYTWNDYNGNGIQELNEFEVAQFSDQAEYLRIILPTLNYIATHQNKFTQTIGLNPQQWHTKKGLKKFISKLYNQSFILVDNKRLRDEKTFNLNPFDVDGDALLGLNFNLNNSLSFNRGKKRYSTTYNFIKSHNKSTSTIDIIENELQLNQLKFEHKIGVFWVLDIGVSNSKNKTESFKFTNRNFDLITNTIEPKFSYYYNDKTNISLLYQQRDKTNSIGNLESLSMEKIGFQLNYSKNIKTLVKAELNLIKNKFSGNSNTAVAYQMLEGLQPDQNVTWSLLFNKKINSFLNLNLNYEGRKSENSSTIHNGSVQLRAIF